MQTTVEKTDKHTVKLTIEVPPDEFAKDLDRAYRKIAQQVKIPGFRKGKVPKQIIDAQIGRDAVLGEFLEDSVPAYFRDALREKDLAPITDPDIDLEQLEDDKPLVFTATVEVRPRLRLAPADYKGLEVERPAAEVTDEEIDGWVDRSASASPSSSPSTRPRARGDFVVDGHPRDRPRRGGPRGAAARTTCTRSARASSARSSTRSSRASAPATS